MKIIKGLAIFFVMICFGSCFDPPEFPVTPEIEFNKIEFVDAQRDSLILYINFRDGDGDLGIDGQDPKYISYPFNNSFYFQEDNGGLDTLFTNTEILGNTQYLILDIPDPSKGKLVTPRTRRKPGYGFLPFYNCANYEYFIDGQLWIDQKDLPALDPLVRLVDTLKMGVSGPVYYKIQDTLYVSPNPNHYNIEIDFLVSSGGVFQEFDWKKELCQSFDGRFPVLTERPGIALEGTLQYAMVSAGIKELFSVKTLKLRVQIKDRALNRSKVIETPEFTLDKVRK